MSVSVEASELSCMLGGRAAVERVSLAARPGEVLALIGPNGAGKTTLLRALARLLSPQGGAALLGGEAVWSLRPRAVARRLALAQQGGVEGTPLTVEQLVGLGRAPHRGWLLPLAADDRAAVERALERTGVAALRGRPLAEPLGRRAAPGYPGPRPRSGAPRPAARRAHGRPRPQVPGGDPRPGRPIGPHR